MKIKNILLMITSLFVILSGVSADYRVYDNIEDFEREKGAVCEASTDGCNNYFMVDGKVAGGTLMYCENQKIEWSCTKFKDNVVTTKSIETTSVEEGSFCGGIAGFQCSTGYTCVLDGVYPDAGGTCKADEQVFCTLEYAPVCGVDGKTYGNRCSAENSAKVKVAYEGECKSNLSQNDENFYNSIKQKLNYKYQLRVNNVVSKYLGLIEKYSNTNKQKITNRIINELELKISYFLLQFPQDIALPSKANDAYLILELFKFELMKLEF